MVDWLWKPLLIAAAAYTAVDCWFNQEIFVSLRIKMTAKPTFLGRLLSCSTCTTYWVVGALVLLLQLPALITAMTVPVGALNTISAVLEATGYGIVLWLGSTGTAVFLLGASDISE